MRFEFVGSNNEADYKALILGLNIFYEAGAKTLLVFSDSQLIVGQVNGEFEAKDDSMKMYLQKVKDFFTKFDKFSLIHIPTLDNAQGIPLQDWVAQLKYLMPTTSFGRSSLTPVSMSWSPKSKDQKHG